jgi:hypothetical protein
MHFRRLFAFVDNVCIIQKASFALLASRSPRCVKANPIFTVVTVSGILVLPFSCSWDIVTVMG